MLLCVGFCGTVHFHAKQQNAKELSANSTLLHPLKIAVIRKSPASRQMTRCWASFMLRFGASFEDKIAYVPFVFLCRFDILRSAHHGNCTSSEQKWTLSLYREKGGEEKEGERRLWERCVNRLRFSTVSIAAAREKRERWLSRSGGLPLLFCSPFSP